MNIAISGATGYIGSHLSKFLTEVCGYRVVPLGREMFGEGMSKCLIQTLSCCDVVINLAGASIHHRWTSDYKKEMYDSRIGTTRCIHKALEAMENRPKLFISTSAVGYYPSMDVVFSSHIPFNEYSGVRGEGFLADLCYAWEMEARCCPSPTRVVIARLGVVLSPDGGAMKEMITPLRRTKMATVIGPGTQPFPWIDMRDLCRAMAFIIEHEAMEGVYNLVAPQHVSHDRFVRMLAKAHGAWSTFVLPRIVFQLLYGEAASLLADGTYVHPTRLLEAGFAFTVPTVEKLFQEIDRTPVLHVDLNRYMGRWYEVARYDHRFERGLTEVTATYTLRADGTIRVENRGVKHKVPYDVCKTSTGHAILPNIHEPGHLRVSFFPFVYSDYCVLELDEENYRYALIGSHSDKYLWILSRTPQLSEEIRRKLIAAAERRGYDTSRLLWVKQP